MDTILEVRNLSKIFYKDNALFTAVDDISFHLKRGEILGIVGESGCGKSTLMKMIVKLLTPDKGKLFLKGTDITTFKGRKVLPIYKDLQMIFQFPFDSFDPRKTLGYSIIEGMINQGMSKKEALSKAVLLLNLCKLEPAYMDRFPHQVSSGQCQRAAIARSIALEPEILICDEATSALDVVTQKQILGLLKHLQHEKNMSYLFICHDLTLVQHFCDRIIVMNRGKLIEEGTPEDVLNFPKENYTKMLMKTSF
jgi:oligopeptide transport system ATP-binding protein